MEYVTPNDMQVLYDADLLIQATNYSDRTAQVIDDVMLAKACDHGNQIVDGYVLHISSSQITSRLEGILRIHAGRLAMDFLAGTDPQIREQAKETMDYLKSLSKLPTNADADNGPGTGDGEGVTLILPVIQFDPGRCWRVTF